VMSLLIDVPSCRYDSKLPCIGVDKLPIQAWRDLSLSMFLV